MIQRPWIFLLTTAFCLSLCTACGVKQQPSASVSPSSTALEDHIEYDFSEMELDEYTRSFTGFQGLPWGFPLPQELPLGRTPGAVTVVSSSQSSFAGLPFRADHLFTCPPNSRHTHPEYGAICPHGLP